MMELTKAELTATSNVGIEDFWFDAVRAHAARIGVLLPQIAE